MKARNVLLHAVILISLVIFWGCRDTSDNSENPDNDWDLSGTVEWNTGWERVNNLSPIAGVWNPESKTVEWNT